MHTRGFLGGRGHGAGDAGGHDRGDSDQASAMADEQEAVAKLVSDTKAGAARFDDLEVAQAEGYKHMKGRRGETRPQERSSPSTTSTRSTSKTGMFSIPSVPRAWCT